MGIAPDDFPTFTLKFSNKPLISQTDLTALGLTILITTISTCGLGLLMGCLALITVNVMFVNNFVYFLLLIFSGANVPIAQLQAWMQAISYALPEN